MDLTKKKEIISAKEIYVDDPAFYEKAFTFAAQQRKQIYARDGDNFKRVIAEEYNDLSVRLDITKFQESCSVRNVLRTRRLANLLINDNGEINLTAIPKVISHLKRHLYSLGPNRQYDAKRQEHLLKVLTALNDSKELQRLIKNFDKPISQKNAEQIIRDTLLVSTSITLTNAHARRAVLSAWMCLLRQNVGSCFATAPGIIIHQEQPELFLKDLISLLNTGRLKRTFGGIEYAVPLSASWGAGDLKKPFVLYLGESFESSRLWLSPGLENAFSSIGIIDPDLSPRDKQAALKQLLKEYVLSFTSKHPYTWVTAEEVIKQVVLKKLGISQQDLEDYQNRPHGMIHGGLLMQVNASTAGKGKGELCAIFLAQFKVACNAFKGLADNALLKAWEFSLASFAETKAQFTRWNLYSSLGFGPNEKGGIGACLFEIIKRKLDSANQRVSDFQFEYEQAFNLLKTMEARMRSVSSEREGQWLKIEYQAKRNEFYTLEEMRDKLHYKAQRLANLYDVIIEKYDEMFPNYFQEVYDADMHDVSAGPYDDSPAGFRLLYKYGRSNTSQWTYIKTPNEFIEALVAFFTATENEISSSNELEGMETELSEIVTAVVNHVRSKEFLETAFHRMAVAHNTPMIKDPLEHLDKIEKKPWAYTSGGTMSTLVSCYFKLENKPTDVSKWMESPTEFMVFLVDTLKQISPKIMEGYLASPAKSMLIHSPTHAFLLKPGMSPFREAWLNDAFTYTWVRDNIIIPRKEFVQSISLDEQKMAFLAEHLSEKVHENYRHYFKKSFGSMYGNKTPDEFRNYILNAMKKEKGLRAPSGEGVISADEIDSALYALLPLFPRSQLRERLENIYAAIPSITDREREELMATYDVAAASYASRSLVDAANLQEIAKGLFCLTFEETTTEIDYHGAVSQAAQKLEYAMPGPIIFADTNWVKEEFGFIVNPGTGEFELWRIDVTGRIGAPMSAWDQWLNGSMKSPAWGIYTKPYEYQAHLTVETTDKTGRIGQSLGNLGNIRM